MGIPMFAALALGVGLIAPLPQPVAGPEDGAETAELRFQAHKDWEVHLPSETWLPTTNGIHVGGVTFPVQRAGEAKIEIDSSADGRFDSTVKGVTGFVLLRSRGETSFEYAVRLRNEGKTWSWSTSGTISGRVRGETVHLVDQNGDGRYDTIGQDAMLIGARMDRSTLLSSVVNLGGALYHFEVDGTTVTTRPYMGETARLEVESGWEGRGKLASAVFADGAKRISFDPTGASGGLLVPAGTYSFHSGKAIGKGESVLMRAGTSAPIELAANETRKLTWGGPVTMVFDYDVRDEEVTVGADLRFFGEAGEEYHTFKPDAKSPKILIKDKKSGKLVDSGRFGGC